ncbi:MAG: methyltransferase [Gemmatimonadaceae bacterium]
MTATDTPVEQTAAHWTVDPFRVGSREEFAKLRTALEAIGFTGAQICNRAGISVIYDLVTLPLENSLLNDNDSLAIAIRLLIAGQFIAWEIVRAAFAGPLLEAMEPFGLLVSTAATADMPPQCAATISLYPIAGVLLAADRHSELAPVASGGVPEDIVYTAIADSAQQFVTMMPDIACDDYLELCSGTGVAALLSAGRNAKRATAVDIADRSTRFATFNAALNGFDNVTAVTGDLYAPVEGQTFDVISAHPPYMPAMERKMVYRDAGEDGEQITRAILGGLPRFLRRGGSFYGRCLMTDRKNGLIEARIREMIGAEESEFDLVLGQGDRFDINAHFEGGFARGTVTRGEADALRHRFEELGVERFFSVVFLLRRRVDPSQRAPITARRVLSPATRGAHLLWYLQWLEFARSAEGDIARFLDARPDKVTGAEFRSRSLMVAGKWSMVNAALVTRVPFIAEGECPPWFGTLLNWCDGRVTAREHLERIRDLEFVGPVFSDEDFGAIIQKLADGGLVSLDICALPVVSGASS